MIFDINALYKAAFPTSRGIEFNQAFYDAQMNVPNFDAPFSADTEGGELLRVRRQIGGTNSVGVPYFMPIRIGNFTLPNEPTIQFAVSKRIVETPLLGLQRVGTVKELIGIEDYQFTIRGICINENDAEIYPETQVKALNDLFKVNESLEILCGLTAILGVSKVVIRSFQMPDMIGVQHAQAYEVQCTSDFDFEIEFL